MNGVFEQHRRKRSLSRLTGGNIFGCSPKVKGELSDGDSGSAGCSITTIEMRHKSQRICPNAVFGYYVLLMLVHPTSDGDDQEREWVQTRAHFRSLARSS
jgi:hypothetical protein